MEMQFKNEIKKLADIGEDEFKKLGQVEEFEAVKKVVLESMERHTIYTNALNKDIADKTAEIEKLKEEVKKLNKSIMNKNKMINTVNGANANLRKEIGAHEEENARLSEKITYWKNKYVAAQEEIEEHDRYAQYWQDKYCGAKEEISMLQDKNGETHKESVAYWKRKSFELQKEGQEEIDKLEEELADKNVEIRDLKEENTYLKKECKNKNDIIKKAYDRYVNEACKGREDIMNECYEKLKKDNGYVGFKLYVKNALTEAKGDEKEANEVITNAVKFFYAEWSKEQKEKEKAEVKGVKGPIVFDEYHKYNWFPCGEDAIE